MNMVGSELVPYVEVRQDRYDELLHKEAMLENIEKLHGRMSDYVFRDAVGYLLKTEPAERKADE
jgi:hypothetical protein